MNSELFPASAAISAIADRAAVHANFFPVHALAIEAAALHLRRVGETKRAIERGRSSEYIRLAEGREQAAAAALAEALRQVGKESKS